MAAVTQSLGKHGHIYFSAMKTGVIIVVDTVALCLMSALVFFLSPEDY